MKKSDIYNETHCSYCGEIADYCDGCSHNFTEFDEVYCNEDGHFCSKECFEKQETKR